MTVGKFTLVLLTIGLLIDLAVLQFVPAGELGPSTATLRFVAMIVAVVVMHEAVHAIAGRLVGATVYAADPHAMRAHLERVVAAYPDGKAARGLLAHACRAAGDREEALRRLDDIVLSEELDESSGEAHWAARGRLASDAKRRTFWRGTIYLEMDRLADAAVGS